MKDSCRFPLALLIAVTACCGTQISSAAVDLSTFTVENYVSLDGPANWIVSGTGNSSVLQTENSDPSIFRSGGSIDVSMKRITGEFLIRGADDDIAGFAFGYQNRGQMYLFGWKEQDQIAAKGMYLSIINTGDQMIDPARNDFANVPGNPSGVQTILKENALSWERNTTYDFVLDFYAGEFDISIYEGQNTLESWHVSDSTFVTGDFGLFNLSQAGVTYSNLDVNPVPTPVPTPNAFTLLTSALSMVAVLGRRQRWVVFPNRHSHFQR